MQLELFINIAITAVCLFGLGLYFNAREKKVQRMAEEKLGDIKDKFIHLTATRKVKEKQEIEKIKGIVSELEKKHKEVLIAQKARPSKDYSKEADAIIKQAEEKADQIEKEVKERADKFLEEQRKEVQTKMVDLVMEVTRKVLTKSLTYKDHKELIESALMEADGEVPDEKGA